MPVSALPPGVGPDDRVVLFDGVCRLCAAWVRFLLRFDRQRCFKLAAVQSPEGQAILGWLGMSTQHFHTMLLLEGAQHYDKSSAFFRVMKQLPLPWPLFGVAQLLPRSLCDWLYDGIAANRYRLFGRRSHCLIPSPTQGSHFLNDNQGAEDSVDQQATPQQSQPATSRKTP